ncbi:MAG: LysE family translocator [bacterium]
MTPIEWLSLAGICLLGAMSPGPSLAVVSAHTLGDGRRAGIVASLSHGFGVALYALSVVSGLALLIAASPLLFQVVQLAGAAFLLYLGVKLLRMRRGDDAGGTEVGARRALLDGFGVALLNPKVALFFLVVFSQFLDAATTLAEKALMVLLAGGIDALVYIGMSIALSSPRVLHRLRPKQRGIDTLFGALLIALAAHILWRQLAAA